MLSNTITNFYWRFSNCKLWTKNAFKLRTLNQQKLSEKTLSQKSQLLELLSNHYGDSSADTTGVRAGCVSSAPARPPRAARPSRAAGLRVDHGSRAPRSPVLPLPGHNPNRQAGGILVRQGGWCKFILIHYVFFNIIIHIRTY